MSQNNDPVSNGGADSDSDSESSDVITLAELGELDDRYVCQ